MTIAVSNSLRPLRPVSGLSRARGASRAVVPLAVGLSACSLLACEPSEPAPAEVTQEVAPALPVPSAAPAPLPKEPVAAPPPEAKERPRKIAMELTEGRRAAIEKRFPEAKGFITAAQLETRLKANEAIKEKEAALRQFDALARGKWVLFAGPMVNLSDAGFELGVVYTPQLPNDPMGMSRQWFPVTLSGIEGYDQAEFEPGNVVVVLAQYAGKGQARSGHELVEAGVWE